MIERRRFHRFTNVPVSIMIKIDSAAALVKTDLLDISLCGIKVRTDAEFNIYELYDAFIFFKGYEEKGVPVKLKVWRIEPDPECNDDLSKYACFEIISFEGDGKKAFTKLLAGFLACGGQDLS